MRAEDIHSGQLNQRIEICRYSTGTSDGAGGTIPNEHVYWSTNAKVKPYVSKQIMDTGENLIQDGFKMLIRFRKDKMIESDMFIKYRDGRLKIIGAPTDYVYQEFIEIRCVWETRPGGVVPGSVVYYGPAQSIPDTQAEVEALTQGQSAHEVTIQTGTEFRFFIIAVRPSTLVKLVTDLEVPSLFGNVTQLYRKRNTVNVNGEEYAIIAMETAVPYSSNHRHKIEL